MKRTMPWMSHCRGSAMSAASTLSVAIADCEKSYSRLFDSTWIGASGKNGTLYVGVTNDLIRRVYEHKNNLVEGFTSRYEVHQLVWFESTPSVEAAIRKEKQIKNWTRDWKIALIEENNPAWEDLYDALL